MKEITLLINSLYRYTENDIIVCTMTAIFFIFASHCQFRDAFNGAQHP